jgi:hypothetical protein
MSTKRRRGARLEVEREKQKLKEKRLLAIAAIMPPPEYSQKKK